MKDFLLNDWIIPFDFISLVNIAFVKKLNLLRHFSLLCLIVFPFLKIKNEIPVFFNCS